MSTDDPSQWLRPGDVTCTTTLTVTQDLTFGRIAHLLRYDGARDGFADQAKEQMVGDLLAEFDTALGQHLVGLIPPYEGNPGALLERAWNTFRQQLLDRVAISWSDQ